MDLVFTGKSPALPAGFGKYVNIAGSSCIEAVGADVALLVAEILGYLGIDSHGGGLTMLPRRKPAQNSGRLKKEIPEQIGSENTGSENTTIPEDTSGRDLQNTRGDGSGNKYLKKLGVVHGHL